MVFSMSKKGGQIPCPSVREVFATLHASDSRISATVIKPSWGTGDWFPLIYSIGICYDRRINDSASTMALATARDGGSVGYAGAFADRNGGCGKKTPYPPYKYSALRAWTGLLRNYQKSLLLPIEPARCRPTAVAMFPWMSTASRRTFDYSRTIVVSGST